MKLKIQFETKLPGDSAPGSWFYSVFTQFRNCILVTYRFSRRFYPSQDRYRLLHNCLLDVLHRRIHHGVHYEFNQPSIVYVGPILEFIVLDQVSELSLAVRARGTYESGAIINRVVLKGVQYLLDLHPARYAEFPVSEVHGRHDGEPTSAAAAVVLCAARGHLPELRTNRPQDPSLRLDYPH